MVNIFDNANEMANILKETEAYQTWDVAFKAVTADPTSLALFQKFQTLQASVQQMMQMQQQPTKEQEETWNATAKEVQENAAIADLMTAEQALNQLLSDINDAVTRPITEAYRAVAPKND